MIEGWTVPELRSLQRQESLLGMPLGYAALLITTSMLVAFRFQYVPAAGVLFLSGWGLGVLVTYYDPFGWQLLLRNLTLPKMLKAS